MTTEKRSNEAACERSEARTQAFWRVVRDSEGVREYYGNDNLWSDQPRFAMHFPSRELADKCVELNYGRVVPVYHRIIKKPKGHGIAWAVKMRKQGRAVRPVTWTHSSWQGTVLSEKEVFGNWELAE